MNYLDNYFRDGLFQTNNGSTGSDPLRQILGINKPVLPPPITPTFQKRINNPEAYGVLHNQDNSISTHLMSTAEKEGIHYAFPLIVEKDGKLFKYEEKDWKEALDWNIANDNVKVFATREEAGDYSQNYKTEEFKAYMNKTYPPSLDRSEYTTDEHPSDNMGGDIQTLQPLVPDDLVPTDLFK